MSAVGLPPGRCRFGGGLRAVSEENPSAGAARCTMLISAGDHAAVSSHGPELVIRR
jgi:hypothetical protein